MNSHFGFVVLDKPAGISSHDCVHKLRKIFGTRKVGHGGTLDPAVTGVLPIALGNATRLIPYLTSEKTYIGTIELGKRTDTDDLEGKVISKTEIPTLHESLLNEFLDCFRGEIMQRPPNFSSVHIKGERAYKKARRGESFLLPFKSVHIKKLKLLNWDASIGRLDLYIHCSSGTYIRSLARELGDKIGCGGVLAKLRRIEALGFNEKQSINLQELQNNSLLNERYITNPILALKHLPIIELTQEEDYKYWQTGRTISFKEDRYKYPKNAEADKKDLSQNFILVLNENKQIIGIGKKKDTLIIRPKVVFNAKG